PPKLEEPLNHSIAKLNAENNGTFYFKIDTVKKATVQVVAGKKYSIVFIARETTCSKGSNEELTKSCEINKHGPASTRADLKRQGQSQHLRVRSIYRQNLHGWHNRPDNLCQQPCVEGQEDGVEFK
uniref:Cystatin domain-containing protein n=1 Tax=Cyprinus carpio TaxID=7962 RepID=A0A8C2FIC8_CYPCA